MTLDDFAAVSRQVPVIADLKPAGTGYLENLHRAGGVPALLGVGLATFTLATFVGIIPGSLVFASVGNGLGAVLDAGEKPDLGIIFRPAVLLPMLGLAALAMVPVLYRAIVKRRPQRV